MTPTSFLTFLDQNWAWAFGLAFSMFSLTAFATLLHPERRDDLALWLLGAHNQASWSKSFVLLFDSVFGDRHLSLKCLLRSVLSSLIAVILIWLLMGNSNSLLLRVRVELALSSVLIIGLIVNVLADYLSLLETRWLLGRMPRGVLAQIGVLIFDLLISTAIIWSAIFAYLHSPLHEGEAESFAEILGVFSVFSVFFYSTFLTSIWTWIYIVSTWFMRLVARLNLGFWLDIEKSPVKILFFLLSVITGVVTFTGAIILSLVIKLETDGIGIADRALCSVFKGRVCINVAELSSKEQTQLKFLSFACISGVTPECINRATAIWKTDADKAARLYRAACDGGDLRGCTDLGYMHEEGLIINADPQRAASLYSKSCENGYARGCYNLGGIYLRSTNIDADPHEAARLYRQSCEDSYLSACNSLGSLYEDGNGVETDPQEAFRLFKQSCEGSIELGCTNLANLYRRGIGIEADPQEAARIYRQSCERGHAHGCTYLADFYRIGLGVEADPQEVARLYRLGCEGGHSASCTLLARLYHNGSGVEVNLQEAERRYRQGCNGNHVFGCFYLGILLSLDAEDKENLLEAEQHFRFSCENGIAIGCTILAHFYRLGIGVNTDAQKASKFYIEGCKGGDAEGCTGIGFLAEFGIGGEIDLITAELFYRKGCDGGNARGCTLLEKLEGKKIR